MIQYGVNRNTNKSLYNKSINIEITPENEIYFDFYMDNIPDVVNICYCDVTDIIDLFNTVDGGTLIQKVFSNELVLNIFPVDTTYISEYEKEYLIGHASLFKRPNVNFYQIWYDPDISFKYYMGSTIHEALLPFIEKYRNYSFDYSKKQNHFLTLNNIHTPDRDKLFLLYYGLSEEDKRKFKCSFKFKNIGLENETENFDEMFSNFSLIFGKNLFPHYDSSLIEIVSESSDEAITEKTFKPLLSGTPFIHWIGLNRTDSIHHQLEFFKAIGIDTYYFGINYLDRNSIIEKVKELLSMNIPEILEKYQDDFIKAEENKKKIFDWIDGITNDIIKK